MPDDNELYTTETATAPAPDPMVDYLLDDYRRIDHELPPLEHAPRAVVAATLTMALQVMRLAAAVETLVGEERDER